MTQDSLIACKIRLPRTLPPVLGVGAYLKNALCLIQGQEAWISRENGSLDNVEAVRRFEATAQALIDTASTKPVLIAHDWHPDFPCTRWALNQNCNAFTNVTPVPAFAGTGSGGVQGHKSEAAVLNPLDAGLRRHDAEGKLESAGCFLLSPHSQQTQTVTPAQAGVQGHESEPMVLNPLDAGLRRHDDGGDGTSAHNSKQMIAIGIQHHHAHVAAVMAEHGIEEPVLGLALDGFGLGANNEAWGGELLCVDAHGFQRLGHLLEMPQPGGDIAARQPWRMGAAALWSLGRGGEIASYFADHEGADKLAVMMERRLNAPMTSSAGRLFDAACGLLRVMPVASFEGEAPMKLESLATFPIVSLKGWQIIEKNDGLVLDMRGLLKTLIGMDATEGANLFHGTLAAALLAWVRKASAQTGIKRVALCGGCFLNKVLREKLTREMMAVGLTPLLPEQLPPGDTAIALGQAYAAALQNPC